ncbi:portal protein [Paenibacillus sp. 1011MAR3C5]|uniref:portal protein n=1 Tax=Paenibacillus sp. 1011MAR3C5 TaxID=1675787 RepID=UPI000E6CD3FA|nr:portal protein [Paenibacillus sp. 1011MAR3C5]RJE90681.1 portal protein [Paenibacillus sp. 1011MAR3C5]
MAKKFQVGGLFPPAEDIERLAKYERSKAVYEGRRLMYSRISELLRDTPLEPQLAKLNVAINVMDTLISKPADMIAGSTISFKVEGVNESTAQTALDRMIRKNHLKRLIHELVTGSGIRGDSWLKISYGVTEELGGLVEEALAQPNTKADAIMEIAQASSVYPEGGQRNKNRFRAINLTCIESVGSGNEQVNYLHVERHLPGYIQYEKFKLELIGKEDSYGVSRPVYSITEQVPTGREEDIVPTGADGLLVFHIPYKTVDDDWRGIGGIEKSESILAAIHDRLSHIDYILWKHADPIAYGPNDLEDGIGTKELRISSKYIPVGKDDPLPGYMKWESQLKDAFEELDTMLSLLFMQSDFPEWLYSKFLGNHAATDGDALKTLLLPWYSKLNRICMHLERALQEALYTAMVLDNTANEGAAGFVSYTPQYPDIQWGHMQIK